MNLSELESLTTQAVADLSAAATPADLEALRIRYLGRNGAVNDLTAALKAAEMSDPVNKAKAAVAAAKACKGKPTAIIMKSVKGKNVSFMENNAAWHGSAPDTEQYNQAIAELDAQIAELEASL